MRAHWLTAAAVAASFAALSLPAFCADSETEGRPTPSSAAPEASGNTAEDTWKVVLPRQNVQGVLGKEVRSSAGENMGRVVDVLVDQAGHVRAAVIDFGGFLGV